MTREDIRSRLTTLMREVFYVDDLEAEDDMTAADVEGWDSLSNIRLIVAIEQHFGVRFSTLEIEGLTDVGALLSLIESKAS